MPFTEMTIEDHQLLNQLRFDRFRKFSNCSLQLCIVRINPENTLAVYCPCPNIIDTLFDDLEDLCHHAGLILGVRSIRLYFCQEEILHAQIVQAEDMNHFLHLSINGDKVYSIRLE